MVLFKSSIKLRIKMQQAFGININKQHKNSAIPSVIQVLKPTQSSPSLALLYKLQIPNNNKKTQQIFSAKNP